MSRTGDVSSLQRRAWGFYGYPGMEQHAVGEVRYVVGWLSDQMTRLDWDVLVDGDDTWSLTLKDKTVLSTTVSGDDGEPVEDLTLASDALLSLIDWNDTNIRAVVTNLFVPGQGDYAELSDGWRVVSTIEPDAKKTLAKVTSVEFLWPHPADPNKPDSPLFGVLELLDELDWLNRQARTQSRQRAMINGVLLTADGFAGPNGETFWDMWNATISARMVNPDDLSPVRLQGPADLVKDGVNWVVPPFGYDQVIDRRVLAAINRLAYGLPVPPEILLGMQAQSRATAFQVEENAYRAHIEPPALMVAKVAQEALQLLVDVFAKGRTVQVVPNPSRLLARRNSVQDVKDAYDRGLVTPEYVREVLGIPEDAAPDPTVDGTPPAGVSVAPTDPANDAAGEASPINASASPDLSSLLADIDASLASELAGATVMCTDRARQRLGAAARAHGVVRDNPDHKGLTNAALAATLGVDGLTAAGVDVADQIAEPVDAATRWWVRRVGEAWAQTAELVPGWSGQGDWITESVGVLADHLVTHIVETLPQPDTSPLDASGIRQVVDVAAGGVTVGVR